MSVSKTTRFFDLNSKKSHRKRFYSKKTFVQFSLIAKDFFSVLSFYSRNYKPTVVVSKFFSFVVLIRELKNVLSHIMLKSQRLSPTEK